MQSEVLYGARLSAVFKGAIPLFFFVALLVNNDGNLNGAKLFLALGLILIALWQMRGAFKPKTLAMDRYGLIYQPPFFGAQTQINWPQIASFEIKGSGKKRFLVLNYLHPENRSVQTLKLGDGWNADGTDMFADKLEKVREHLEEARKRYQLTTQSAAVSAQRPLVEVAKKPAAPQPKSQPSNATVRSGQVYAQPSAAMKAPPVNLAAKPNASSSRPLGWGLLVVGLGLGGASVFAFSKACRDGLCGQSFWDIPDARLWIFFAVWAVCLAVILAGMKKL